MENNNFGRLYNDDDKTIMKLAEDSLDRKADRVLEIVNYCKAANIKTIGIAHCTAVTKEAERFSNILTDQGFKVHSVNCKFGKVPFSDILEDYKGISCNPAGQAEYLAQNKTELNVMMGLCLGHDMVFNEKSTAPVTPLVVKDRKMKHKSIEVLQNNDL